MSVTPESVAAYFSQGFLPDADRARTDFEDLLAMVETHGDAVRGVPVEELMAEELDALQASSWSVTLTGGYDSLFILGVLRKLCAPRPITTYTWGTPDSPDVIGARRAAGRLPHHLLDVRKVEWNGDQIVTYLRGLRPLLGSAMPRLDAVWLFSCIDRQMAPDSLALNGFMGDMVSGNRLKLGLERNGTAPAAVEQMRVNRTGIETSFDAVAFYAAVQRENEAILQRLARLTSFTPLELIDYTFRHRQRIQPSMVVQGNRWVAPHDQPRIIARWALTPLEQRMGQSLYQDRLMAMVGKAALPVKSGQRPLPARLWAKVERRLRRWRTTPAPPRHMTDRADPIHNESLRQLMQDSCRAFDRRGLLPQSTSAAFARLVVQPTLLDWTTSTLALSAEMHLRSMEPSGY